MGLRRAGRELALKALYQMDMVSDRSTDNLRALFAAMPADSRARDFALQLVRGVSGDLEHLDELLAQVITNWSINRLSRIDHNILRLAAYELLNLEDVPARATMDEAIELAKRYGDRNSGQFVNGVLDVLAERAGLKHKGDQDLAFAKE
ncbi:MAG TPA: transcription antitermination factor NusB [Candidatus Binataceae bacterium]|jgi:transcription antitermination factor NusB|nr:transcription antitermination factor NusB [Candidatus Binataceae bacterium]